MKKGKLPLNTIKKLFRMYINQNWNNCRKPQVLLNFLTNVNRID